LFQTQTGSAREGEGGEREDTGVRVQVNVALSRHQLGKRSGGEEIKMKKAKSKEYKRNHPGNIRKK
jgi:hypothetical protein